MFERIVCCKYARHNFKYEDEYLRVLFEHTESHHFMTFMQHVLHTLSSDVS